MNYRTYSSKSAAKAAIKKAGLHLLPVEFRKSHPQNIGHIMPVLKTELAEDAAYIRNEKNFAAESQEENGQFGVGA